MSRKETHKSTHPYSLIGVAMLFYLYEIFLQVSPSVMMQDLVRDFHISAFAFGNMAATYFYIYTLMQLPAGVLYDRFGVRWIMVIAFGVCVFGALLFAIADQFYLLCAGRFFIGMGSAFALIGILKIATNDFPESKLSFLIGLTTALGTTGAILSNLLLAHLVDYVSWRQAMQITFIAGVLLLIALVGCLSRFYSVRDSYTSHQTISQLLHHLWGLAKLPKLWLNSFIALFTYLPLGVFASLWSVPYMRQGQGFSTTTASLINSLLFFACGVCSPIIGKLSDKIHRRKIFLIVAAVVGMIASYLVIYSPNLSARVIGALYCVMGACVACETLCLTISKELSPAKVAATSFAFTNLIVCLGISVIQPSIGLIIDKHYQGLKNIALLSYEHHTFIVALSVMPLCYLLALIMLYWLPETGSQR